MKKLALLAALVVLALGVFILPAAAQAQDLTPLAGYLPADAPVYVGFRSDDAFISTLDSLASKLDAVIPGGMMSGSLQEALDGLATEIEPGGTFATTIRPWMGDTAAFGVYTLDPSIRQPYTIVLSIKDRDKAESLVDNLLTTEEYAVKDGDGYTVYSPKSTLSSQPNYIFRSDVLIATSDKALVEAGGNLTSKLSDAADFSTAVGLLPESQYNGVIYTNTPALLTSMMEDNVSRRDRQGMEMFTSMLDAIKPQVYGLTILDDRSLTIDVVAPYNTDASSPMLMTTAKQPINPDFARHILAGTPLVAQGTDLYDNYESALANLRTLAESMPSSANMKPYDVETALWGLGFLVRGLTGEEPADALGWMTGDYALTLGFSPSFTDANSIFAVAQSMPVEFGLIVEATDADAAQTFYDGLTRSLAGFPDPRVTVAQETLDSGAGALSITIQGQNTPVPDGTAGGDRKRRLRAGNTPHRRGRAQPEECRSEQ